MSVLELESAFEKLPPAERQAFAGWYEARLAHCGPSDEITEDWISECKRRLGELRGGPGQGLPVSQVMEALRSRFVVP